MHHNQAVCVARAAANRLSFCLALILPCIINQQADAKRIYREMYILRHMRHNEIIHLIDVLMPAAYENFRDLYLVIILHSCLSSYRSRFLHIIVAH